MQNKANLQKAQINTNSCATKDYRKNDAFAVQKNKPNSNPICQRVKLMQSVYLQRIMKKNADKGYEKTKPKQTQFPKVPKRTQTLFYKRIMKMNHLRLRKNKPNSPPNFEKISVLNFVKLYKILTTYEISF